jgi:hypothetical protein
MAKRYTEAFRRGAVRIATTEGFTLALSSILRIDDRARVKPSSGL